MVQAPQRALGLHLRPCVTDLTRSGRSRQITRVTSGAEQCGIGDDAIMVLSKEPDSYYKTALSDLQGAWGLLREAVVGKFDFPNSDKLLFHIDEAMSWECVRNLKLMKETLLVVHNLASQYAPREILDEVEGVRGCLDEVFAAIAEGEKF
jgi:hypothetical protein